MNGYSYLRTHRILACIGYGMIFYAMYYFSVPNDHGIEEYSFYHSGAHRWNTSRTACNTLPSMRFRTAHLPISQK